MNYFEKENVRGIEIDTYRYTECKRNRERQRGNGERGERQTERERGRWGEREIT